jgi:putative acetyltransferase
VIVREQRPGDQAAVREVLTAAFRDSGEVAHLAETLAARADRPGPGCVLVAESEGTVVGHVQLSRGWIDPAPRLVEVVILSPLGVAPSHHRSGVGTALCRAALEQARGLGMPAVFLEGDPAYYARLGWEPAGAHGFTAPSTRIPPPGFQVVLLPSWQSWMVGPVVYNDTFWALDFVGLRSSA